MCGSDAGLERIVSTRSWLTDTFFDPILHRSHKHHFWVDTKATPPRSIWTHPLDDPAFLKANPQFASSKGVGSGKYAPPSSAPPGAAPQHAPSPAGDEHRRIKDAGERAARRAAEKPAPSGMKKISRNMKDKSTGMNHVERARAKAEHREMEQIALEHRRKTAEAFIKAAQFGQAQYLGRDDRSGTEYWAEPPPPGYPPHLLNQFPPPYGFESRREGPRTFVRPALPTMAYRGGYGPMGGGGMGLPIAGGLLGGMMLGGLLF